jgi:hypothetical protein
MEIAGRVAHDQHERDCPKPDIVSVTEADMQAVAAVA